MLQRARNGLIGTATLALCAGLFFAKGLFTGTVTLLWDVADYTYPILAPA